MYIESKADGLNGPARIGRVTFSKTGRTIYYGDRTFRATPGYKYRHCEVGGGGPHWISGPRKDGLDRLYPQSRIPVDIDEDVREEYWTTIRERPDLKERKTT